MINNYILKSKNILFKFKLTQHYSMTVFNRKMKLIQRNRTAKDSNYELYDYLREEFGWRLADRIDDVKRNFSHVLDLGCSRGYISKNMQINVANFLCQCDMSTDIMLQGFKNSNIPSSSLVVDEEYLPFRPNIFDLVISNLSLHWVNDLPGTFKQIHRTLVDDGCFIGSMFGGDTLHELRVSLYLAEQERLGGFSPHISPFTSAQDLGSLLNRAGFTMLTIDIDELIVNYPSMMQLLFDLQGMGENNCSLNRKPIMNKDVLLSALAIYQEKYSSTFKDSSFKGEGEGLAEEKSGISAVFEVVNFIAWKADKSQLKPAERGSGQISIKEIGNLSNLEEKINELKTIKDDSKKDS